MRFNGIFARPRALAQPNSVKTNLLSGVREPYPLDSKITYRHSGNFAGIRAGKTGDCICSVCSEVSR
jgi:hypothetical protein